MARTIQRFSHPEIELRAVDVYAKSDGIQHTTLLDLLEVYPERATWTPKLDHTQLLRYFYYTDNSSSNDDPSLRIFFVEDLNFLDASHADGESHPEVSTTAYWMHHRFGVSPLFFSGITARGFAGQASFVRRQSGKRVALDGMYRFSSGLLAHLTRVWFSHRLRGDRASTYIVYACPENAKNAILSCAQDDNRLMLLRPLSIDAFFAEERLDEWGKDVLPPRDELILYENSRISMYTPAQMAKAVENLHALSQLLHVIRGHLTDLHERLRFLVEVHQQLLDLTARRGRCQTHSAHPGSFDGNQEVGNDSDDEGDEGDTDSVLDSFKLMLSKTAGLMRWVTNYNERTGIRINLLFNISTQTDNRTNLDIARLTSKIAVSTQKDSSSMITMAAVTMLFLPGTFISALFSMVFFNTRDDGALVISKQVWLFPVITIPLTIAVFVLWVVWQRYRSRVDARSLGIWNERSVFEDSGSKEKGLDALLG